MPQPFDVDRFRMLRGLPSGTTSKTDTTSNPQDPVKTIELPEVVIYGKMKNVLTQNGENLSPFEETAEERNNSEEEYIKHYYENCVDFTEDFDKYIKSVEEHEGYKKDPENAISNMDENQEDIDDTLKELTEDALSIKTERQMLFYLYQMNNIMVESQRMSKIIDDMETQAKIPNKKDLNLINKNVSKYSKEAEKEGKKLLKEMEEIKAIFEKEHKNPLNKDQEYIEDVKLSPESRKKLFKYVKNANDFFKKEIQRHDNIKEQPQPMQQTIKMPDREVPGR